MRRKGIRIRLFDRPAPGACSPGSRRPCQLEGVAALGVGLPLPDDHYFTSKKVGELDFLLERADGSILAIEVKSGSNYMTHAALDNALAVRDYHIDEAIVLAETNVEARDGITFLPIYSACLLMP